MSILLCCLHFDFYFPILMRFYIITKQLNYWEVELFLYFMNQLLNAFAHFPFFPTFNDLKELKIYVCCINYIHFLQVCSFPWPCHDLCEIPIPHQGLNSLVHLSTPVSYMYVLLEQIPYSVFILSLYFWLLGPWKVLNINLKNAKSEWKNALSKYLSSSKFVHFSPFQYNQLQLQILLHKILLHHITK